MVLGRHGRKSSGASPKRYAPIIFFVLTSEGAKRGSYLVRFSAKSEGQFTISYVTKNAKGKGDTIAHTRLVQPINQSIAATVKNFCKTSKLKIPLSGRPSKFVVLYPESGSSGSSTAQAVPDYAKNYVTAQNFGGAVSVSDDGVMTNVNDFAWGDSSVVM